MAVINDIMTVLFLLLVCVEWEKRLKQSFSFRDTILFLLPFLFPCLCANALFLLFRGDHHKGNGEWSTLFQCFLCSSESSNMTK